MSKHSEQFKLSVIQDYLSGVEGFQKVAQRRGIDGSMLRRWVAAYRLHGDAGIVKKYMHYNAQFKLSVLRHMWGKGLSHRETAAVFDIRHAPNIGIWERQYYAGGVEALASRRRGRPKKMPDAPITPPPSVAPDQTRTREQLLEEINYLRMENAYLKKLEALVQADKKAAQRKKRK
jgi:transposase